MIRKQAGDVEAARIAFQESIEADFRCWPAWDGLADLVDLFYPASMDQGAHANSWQCSLFIAETMFRLQMFLSAIESYCCVSYAFGQSPYLICQIAAAQSELQGFYYFEIFSTVSHSMHSFFRTWNFDEFIFARSKVGSVQNRTNESIFGFIIYSSNFIRLNIFQNSFWILEKLVWTRKFGQMF